MESYDFCLRVFFHYNSRQTQAWWQTWPAVSKLIHYNAMLISGRWLDWMDHVVNVWCHLRGNRKPTQNEAVPEPQTQRRRWRMWRGGATQPIMCGSVCTRCVSRVVVVFFFCDLKDCWRYSFESLLPWWGYIGVLFFSYSIDWYAAVDFKDICNFRLL